MKTYTFFGSATDQFGKEIASNYRTITIAKSREQAMNNIKYNLNKKLGKLPNNKIKLIGKLIVEEEN